MIGLEPPPPELEAFQRVVCRPRPAPDFVERSIHVADALWPWRITAYFDVDRHAPEREREGWLRASALEGPLGIGVPDALGAAWREGLGGDPAVRQVAIGLDVRADAAATRLKLYVVTSGDSSRVTARLCGALAVQPPPTAKLSLTHIIGIDLTRAGLHDVKLYYALDRQRAPRSLRDRARWRELLAGADTIVYAHGLLGGRRSLHVRARPEVLWDELDRLGAPSRAELDARLRAMGCTRDAAASHAPTILGLPWHDGEIDPTSFTVYLHPLRR